MVVVLSNMQFSQMMGDGDDGDDDGKAMTIRNSRCFGCQNSWALCVCNRNYRHTSEKHGDNFQRMVSCPCFPFSVYTRNVVAKTQSHHTFAERLW